MTPSSVVTWPVSGSAQEGPFQCAPPPFAVAPFSPLIQRLKAIFDVLLWHRGGDTARTPGPVLLGGLYLITYSHSRHRHLYRRPQTHQTSNASDLRSIGLPQHRASTASDPRNIIPHTNQASTAKGLCTHRASTANVLCEYQLAIFASISLPYLQVSACHIGQSTVRLSS